MGKIENHEDDPGIVDTHEQVSKVFSVSDRTVRYWVSDGMPKRPDGRYSIKDIQEWRFLKNHGGANAGVGKRAKGSHWEEEYRKYKALTEELKYQQTVGKLVPREEIEEGLIQITVAIKRAFLSIPRSMAPQLIGLDPREIEVLLTTKIKSIIAMFYDNKIFQDYARTKKAQKKKSNVKNP